MEKSVYSREYALLLQLLRRMRHEAGVTQVELARRLGKTQSFVSKWERGEVRLDVVQLRWVCQALGTTLMAFVAEYERGLSGIKNKRGTRQR